MPVVWNLRKWLAVNRDIYRPVDLQRLLAEKAGVQLSLQAVSALMQSTPSAIRIATLEALCAALDCKASEFFDVLPPTSQQREKQKKAVGDTPTRLYGSKGTKDQHKSGFPDPYEHQSIAHELDQTGRSRKHPPGTS